MSDAEHLTTTGPGGRLIPDSELTPSQKWDLMVLKVYADAIYIRGMYPHQQSALWKRLNNWYWTIRTKPEEQQLGWGI